MNIMIFVLGGFLFSIYFFALINHKDILKILVSGIIEAEDLKITFQEIASQTKIFLVFILIFNLGVWLICFTQINHYLGGIGATLTFFDFVANNEVFDRLSKVPFSESNAKKIIFGFYALYILYLICLLTMMTLVFL